MPYCYEYPRPALTVDCVLFSGDADGLQVLLIQRDRDPFAGRWALPGGFVEQDEDPDAAAHRELAEETGVTGVALTQLHTFGKPGRDPRGHTVSVVYYTLLDRDAHVVTAADDARNAGWFPINATPPLAFDHAEILTLAVLKLQGK